jgi:hypothetical protein
MAYGLESRVQDLELSNLGFRIQDFRSRLLLLG